MSNPAHYPDADDRSKAIEAVTLRRSGLTYREIAVQTGYWTDESGARHAVSRLLARQETEGVAELRAIECERLDALQRAVWDAAIGGDVDAVKAALQVIDRRAKLLGLNAPTRVQVAPDEVNGTEFATRAAELIAELRPDTLRQMFATTPEAVAVFGAGSQTAPPEGNGLPDPVSGASVAHSAEIATTAVCDAGGWSNVGAVEHISPAQADLSGIPGEVLAAAAAAESDDAAAEIIARYRRMAR